MSDPRISNVCGCGRVLGALAKEGKCMYCQPQETKLPNTSLRERIALLMDTEFGFQREEFEQCTLPVADRILALIAEQPEDAMQQRAKDVIEGTIDFDNPAAVQIAHSVEAQEHRTHAFCGHGPGCHCKCNDLPYRLRRVERGPYYELAQRSADEIERLRECGRSQRLRAGLRGDAP